MRDERGVAHVGHGVGVDTEDGSVHVDANTEVKDLTLGALDPVALLVRSRLGVVPSRDLEDVASLGVDDAALATDRRLDRPVPNVSVDERLVLAADRGLDSPVGDVGVDKLAVLAGDGRLDGNAEDRRVRVDESLGAEDRGVGRDDVSNLQAKVKQRILVRALTLARLGSLSLVSLGRRASLVRRRRRLPSAWSSKLEPPTEVRDVAEVEAEAGRGEGALGAGGEGVADLEPATDRGDAVDDNVEAEREDLVVLLTWGARLWLGGGRGGVAGSG